MRTSILKALTIWTALLGVVRASLATEQQDTIAQLRNQVDECERQAAQAQCQLAEAKARLALAEGKRDLAASELRRAVPYYESVVTWLLQNANRFCDPAERLD